jgi:hypothetical protein
MRNNIFSKPNREQANTFRTRLFVNASHSISLLGIAVSHLFGLNNIFPLVKFDTSICEYGYPQESGNPNAWDITTLAVLWPTAVVPLSIQNFADFASMFVYQNMGKTVYSFDFIGDKPRRNFFFISTVILSYHYPLSQK